MIRIGFGVCYTMTTVRNPPKPCSNYSGPHIRGLRVPSKLPLKQISGQKQSQGPAFSRGVISATGAMSQIKGQLTCI